MTEHRQRLLENSSTQVQTGTRPSPAETSSPIVEVTVPSQLLYRVEEAAVLLRLGRTTMYALIKDGRIRAVHIGRSCRISRAELERFATIVDGDAAPAHNATPAHRQRGRRTPTNQDGLFDVRSPSGAA